VDDDINPLDCLVERAILGDIVNNDQLKPITILGELIFEEGAFSERANGAADRVLCF